MASQCTNPKAANYNPQATVDDGSCLYLNKIGDNCYLFEDAIVEDESWTLSYSLEGQNWAFFHGYAPDFYFSTREKLWAIKSGRIFRMNAGAPGDYGGGPEPFFVDVVIRETDDNGKTWEATLNSLDWISSIVNPDGSDATFETLTHITIWNNKQCTGRIPLAEVFRDLTYNSDRLTQGRWNFNNFRDKVKTQGISFLQDIFSNFAVVPTALSDTLPWFEQQLMEGLYFIVRLEFDNLSGKKLYLEDVEADTAPSYR